MDADVIVLGLGGMGSAAAAHLATRGARVLGLERFTPAHAFGSSHGESRIIRMAYFEHAAYVPLLRRAYQLYDDLNREDPGLFVRTGGLMLGQPDSVTVAGSLGSARQWGLAHELLDAEQLRRRFPALRPEHDTVGLYEPTAGFVRPERTVLAHLARAKAAGAQLRYGEPALRWHADSAGVTVRTAHQEYRSEHLVVTAGAWSPRLLADLNLPLVVERQVLYWFRPSRAELFDAKVFPVFIWQDAAGLQLYGFPDLGDGTVKVSFFRHGTPTDPDTLDRDIHPEEIDVVRAALNQHVPAAAGDFVRGAACMYTTTPDQHFVIGRHPQQQRVIVAAGFSGHGFKFTPVVGEIIADLALQASTNHPIELFSPPRFGSAGPPP